MGASPFPGLRGAGLQAAVLPAVPLALPCPSLSLDLVLGMLLLNNFNFFPPCGDKARPAGTGLSCWSPSLVLQEASTSTLAPGNLLAKVPAAAMKRFISDRGAGSREVSRTRCSVGLWPPSSKPAPSSSWSGSCILLLRPPHQPQFVHETAPGTGSVGELQHPRSRLGMIMPRVVQTGPSKHTNLPQRLYTPLAHFSDH